VTPLHVDKRFVPILVLEDVAARLFEEFSDEPRSGTVAKLATLAHS